MIYFEDLQTSIRETEQTFDQMIKDNNEFINRTLQRHEELHKTLEEINKDNDEALSRIQKKHDEIDGLLNSLLIRK